MTLDYTLEEYSGVLRLARIPLSWLANYLKLIEKE